MVSFYSLINVINCPFRFPVRSKLFLSFDGLGDILFDDQAFVDDLEQAPFRLIYLSDDPDFQLNLLYSILVEHIDRHAPLLRVCLRRPPAPWMK